MDKEVKKVLFYSGLFWFSLFFLIYFFFYTTSGRAPEWTYKSLKFSEVSADSPAIIQNDIIYFCSGPTMATYEGRWVFLNAVRKDGTGLWSIPIGTQCSKLEFLKNEIHLIRTRGGKNPAYKKPIILNGGYKLIINPANGQVLKTLPDQQYIQEPLERIPELELRHKTTKDLNIELFTPKHIFVTDKKTGKIILDFGATGRIHGFIEDSDSLYVYDDDGKLYMFRK